MKRLNLINFKIRTKMLLIYAFSVLLPLIVTDALVLYSINQNSEKEKRAALQHVMERVEYNLSETVDGCILFTSNFYTDRMMNAFLTKTYRNDLDYYNDYYRLLINNSISYNYNYGSLYKIDIYSDNDTITNGKFIATKNSVKDKEWYQAFKKSGEDIFLYTYYDSIKNMIPGIGTSRTISIMRKLDNFGDTGMEQFLKIDLDYGKMLKDVLNEQIDGDIYVRNDDYILFSNINASSTNHYESADTINDKKITMSQNFKTGNQNWEVLIVAKDTTFWTEIGQAKGLLLFVVLILIFPTIIIYFVGKSITKRLSIINTYLGKVKKEQFEVINLNEGEDEIGHLIRSYNRMVTKIKELIEVVFKGNAEKQTLELAKKEAELKAIQSQVNPHFLFNTLETIRMRSLIKNENETADIIGELAILFRKSMSWGADFITIDEEMTFADKYINIQKYRFGDKIKYNHYVMEECRQLKIPKLSIVTFIENACVHGIERIVDEGVISVNITKNSNYLFIEISDNGTGFEEAKLKDIKRMMALGNISVLNESKNTGVLNAFLRLKMYCEGNIEFEIDSVPDKGTDITIQLNLEYIEGVSGIKILHKEEELSDDQSDDCR